MLQGVELLLPQELGPRVHGELAWVLHVGGGAPAPVHGGPQRGLVHDVRCGQGRVASAAGMGAGLRPLPPEWPLPSLPQSPHFSLPRDYSLPDRLPTPHTPHASSLAQDALTECVGGTVGCGLRGQEDQLGRGVLGEGEDRGHGAGHRGREAGGQVLVQGRVPQAWGDRVQRSDVGDGQSGCSLAWAARLTGLPHQDGA